MSASSRLLLTLALCGLSPGVARAQELLPAVSFRTVAGVQFDMWPADFNRDGITDVAALGSSRRLAVWIGNGDGTFRTPLVSAHHVRPIATGDVNRDGRTDVIGVFLWDETQRVDLAVLPGRGDGTFAEPISIAPSGQLEFAVLADLDNDSRVDVIGAHGGESTEVLIWPGNGDFTFDEPVPVTSGGEGPLAAFVTDMNGDGRRDVAVAHQLLGVSLLTNTGSFTFTVTAVPSGSGRTTDVTARDVDGDGALDLLISGRTGEFFDRPWIYGYVFVARGNGRGAFTAAGEYPSGRGANSIVFGDFTRDGVVDVATLNHSFGVTRWTNCFGEMFQGANSVSILEGHGDGTFGLPTTFAVEPQVGDRTLSYAPFSLETLNTSDLDRDRFPDLLVGEGKILFPVAPRENRVPAAFAAADFRTTNSTEIPLDGTGTDPDGHFLEFQWTGGAGGTLRESDKPLACYDEPTVTGQHVFTLTVSDGHGGIDSDDLAVYLVRPPSVTVVAPAEGDVVPAGQPYTIRWTATSEDPLEGFFVYGLREGSGIFFEVDGCAGLPPTARQCTWTSTGAPTAEARIYIEAFDVSGQFGADYSGPFVIGGGGVPAGWQNRDIGAVGAPGRASLAGDVFTVTGSGADIWSTSDEFHYAYTAASGNFEIVARVASVQNVNQWTKAGVMLREGTGAGARHASLFITPTTVKGVAFQRRPVTGGASVHTAGPAFGAPGWVRLVRNLNTVAAYYRRDESASWQLIGTQAFSGLAETLLVGLAVSSHVDGRLATATFDHVAVTSGRFQSADVGAVGVPGTTSPGSTNVTIEGGGADIWGTADAFRYYYRPWTGDGTITVRVASIENTHAWAKAGVMFRETLAANSRHVMAIVSPGKGVAVQYRGTAGGSSANAALTAGTAPKWLRLTRSGNLFGASVSDNGTTWRTVGSITIPMASAVFVGLPVTSHNNATLATAVFDYPVVGP